jgi:hypothetical protein
MICRDDCAQYVDAGNGIVQMSIYDDKFQLKTYFQCFCKHSVGCHSIPTQALLPQEGGCAATDCLVFQAMVCHLLFATYVPCSDTLQNWAPKQHVKIHSVSIPGWLTLLHCRSCILHPCYVFNKS